MYTPPALAMAIVAHFRPAGRILEPCAGPLGNQPFVDAIEAHIGNRPEWCEIDEDRDFFQQVNPVDWIVTNPPWSQFRPFLRHSMVLAENVVFLSLLNAWFMRARINDMFAGGFAVTEVLLLETPPKPWPQTGFQLAAVHASRVRRPGQITVKVSGPICPTSIS